MDRRKVLFTDGMSDDAMLIITDAPKESIEEWCYLYNESLENGGIIEPFVINNFKDKYYVKLLHDSELENGNEDVEIIGYDEVYDLAKYYRD